MQVRAIVFEDDEGVRGLLVKILEYRNYEVISASDPTVCSVYEDLRATCPHEFACGDLLVTDNHMPRMTGLDFISRQKQRGCKGVVHNMAVMSANWTDDELAAAGRLGCKVFNKPFNLTEFNSWLDKLEKKIPPDRRLDDLPKV